MTIAVTTPAMPQITVTDRDLAKLQPLLEAARSHRDSPLIDALDTELGRAEVVTAHTVKPDIVTMNTRFVYRDVDMGVEREVTLVYPREADLNAGRLSVLAPIGCALLGLRVGQSIEWQVAGNRTKRLEIVRIVYQPEASGDHDL